MPAVAEPPAKTVDTSTPYTEGAVKPLDLNKEAAKRVGATAPPVKPANVPTDPEPAKEPSEGAKGMADAFTKAMKPVPVEPPIQDTPSTDPKITTPTPGTTTTQPTPPADEPKFTGKKAADWKALKDAREAAERKAEEEAKARSELAAQLEALKKQPGIDPKEHETIKADREALLAKMEVIALEQHPLFIEKFTKPIENAIAAAKAAVGDEVKATAIAELLEMPANKARREQLSAILAEMDNELDRANLAIAVRDLDAARNERKAQLAKAGENVKKLAALEHEKLVNQEATRKKTAEQQTAAATEAALKYAESLAAFQKIEGQDAHNKKIGERQERVKKMFSGQLTQEEMLQLPAKAVEADFLREDVLPRLLEENRKQAETIKAMTAATPELKGGGKVETKGDAKNAASPFIGAFTKHMTGK